MTMTEKAAELRAKGYTYAQIADALKTSRGSVAGMIWRSKPENRSKYLQYLRDWTPKQLTQTVAVGSDAWWKARGF